MKREEIVARLLGARGAFDARVALLPNDRFDVAPPGRDHSPKEIVAHVNAYERLITDRLRAARSGETTAFDRDRVGWEEFNERVWAEVRDRDPSDVREASATVFAELIAEIELLTDAELESPVGITARIDPAWLKDRTLTELIEIDALDHYPMHFGVLDAAKD